MTIDMNELADFRQYPPEAREPGFRSCALCQEPLGSWLVLGSDESGTYAAVLCHDCVRRVGHSQELRHARWQLNTREAQLMDDDGEYEWEEPLRNAEPEADEDYDYLH